MRNILIMNTPKADTPFIDAIRRRGGKLTRQRLLIIQVLDECQDHMDADAVYEEAKKRDPRISLATVYRSLALMKETGLIEEHRLGQKHGHFEKTQRLPHAHFTCQSCGTVIELDVPSIVDLAQQLEDQHHLDISSMDLELEGICPDCLRQTDYREQIIESRRDTP